MIVQMSMKESSSSRTLSSLFLILSLNDFFGSSLRELGISFHNLAPLVSEQHNYFTRGASAQQLLIPFSRINIRKFCPTVIGKYYWNALPVCIRDLTSKTAFKKALCKYYLTQY